MMMYPLVTPSRLIPACAGKTMIVSGFTIIMWAHPRVCGENSTEGK